MSNLQLSNNGMQRDFCGCGLAATGDEPIAPAESQEIEPVKAEVMNMQAWQYAKTALALIGIFVVVKFIYSKMVKA